MGTPTHEQSAHILDFTIRVMGLHLILIFFRIICTRGNLQNPSLVDWARTRETVAAGQLAAVFRTAVDRNLPTVAPAFL